MAKKFINRTFQIWGKRKMWTWINAFLININNKKDKIIKAID